MALAHAKSGATHASTTATTVTLAYTPNAVNDCLLIMCSSNVTTGTITLTDTAGNEIIALDGPVTGGGRIARTFYIRKFLAGATTFTATSDSSSSRTIFVDEFSGHDTSSPIDQH